MKCIYCKGQHPAYNCNVTTHYQERWAIHSKERKFCALTAWQITDLLLANPNTAALSPRENTTPVYILSPKLSNQSSCPCHSHPNQYTYTSWSDIITQNSYCHSFLYPHCLWSQHSPRWRISTFVYYSCTLADQLGIKTSETKDIHLSAFGGHSPGIRQLALATVHSVNVLWENPAVCLDGGKHCRTS